MAVMWTLKLMPLARVVGPQLKVCGGVGELIEHRAALVWLAMDQVTPEPGPAGRRSLTVTPLAVPRPGVLTRIVKPMVSPALTLVAAAVLRMVTLARWQVMVAGLLPPPSLVLVAVAGWLYTVDSRAAGVAGMWKVQVDT